MKDKRITKEIEDILLRAGFKNGSGPKKLDTNDPYIDQQVAILKMANNAEKTLKELGFESLLCESRESGKSDISPYLDPTGEECKDEQVRSDGYDDKSLAKPENTELVVSSKDTYERFSDFCSPSNFLKTLPRIPSDDPSIIRPAFPVEPYDSFSLCSKKYSNFCNNTAVLKDPTPIKPWWEYENFSGLGCNSGLFDIASQLLVRQAIDLNTTTQVGSREGIMEMKPSEVHKILRDLGGKPAETALEERRYIERQKTTPNAHELLSDWEISEIQEYHSERWIWPQAAVSFWKNSTDNQWGFRWYSNNMEVAKGLLKLTMNLTTPEPAGEAYVLIPSQSGLSTASIGMGGTKLIEDNYRAEVVEAFHKAVVDMSRKDPMGRLFLVDGVPGTGKTYLLRAFMDSLPALKFIIVPSNMASSLKGPELISLLLNESDTKAGANQPLVLLIEDADEMLCIRDSSNVSAISSILNISDGIVGNLLNIRILATTNAPIDQIDEAVMRPGRLSARIEVGMLDVDQARRLYDKLGGKEDLPWKQKFYSLAEVYALYKGAELDSCGKERTSCGKKKVAVGFSVANC